MQANSFVFSTIIASLLFFSCDKEEVVKENELPAAAKTYITTHFPSTAITSVVKDKEINKTTYDVVLQDGTSLDFMKDGDCTEVDGHTKKIPDTVVPPKILQYVQTTYSSDFIVSWEKDGPEQDVDLGSKVELKFDKENNFLRIDN